MQYMMTFKSSENTHINRTTEIVICSFWTFLFEWNLKFRSYGVRMEDGIHIHWWFNGWFENLKRKLVSYQVTFTKSTCNSCCMGEFGLDMGYFENNQDVNPLDREDFVQGKHHIRDVDRWRLWLGKFQIYDCWAHRIILIVYKWTSYGHTFLLLIKMEFYVSHMLKYLWNLTDFRWGYPLNSALRLKLLYFEKFTTIICLILLPLRNNF